MITKDNLKALLLSLGFEKNGHQYSKKFADSDTFLKVDFDKNQLIYPEEQGLKIHERQTCNFSANENFVVFECVHRLLEKGYKPEHIELDPKWKLGHGASGGRADILIKDNQGQPLLIIECKTPGNEFNKAWKNTELHGDQLFSYAQQIPDTQFLCLYTADFSETGILSKLSHIISHKDNPKVLEEGKNLKAFKDGGDAKNRFIVWRDTYKKEYTTQGIFEPNIQPYFIGKDKYTLDVLILSMPKTRKANIINSALSYASTMSRDAKKPLMSWSICFCAKLSMKPKMPAICTFIGKASPTIPFLI